MDNNKTLFWNCLSQGYAIQDGKQSSMKKKWYYHSSSDSICMMREDDMWTTNEDLWEICEVLPWEENLKEAPIRVLMIFEREDEERDRIRRAMMYPLRGRDGEQWSTDGVYSYYVSGQLITMSAASSNTSVAYYNFP